MIDLRGRALDLAGIGAVVEVDAGGYEKGVGAEDHREQLAHLHDVGVLFDDILDGGPLLGKRGGADQEMRDVARHPDRDRDQQHADKHGCDRVPVRLAGDLAQPDADGGYRDADQRDRVFEEHHLTFGSRLSRA